MSLDDRAASSRPARRVWAPAVLAVLVVVGALIASYTHRSSSAGGAAARVESAVVAAKVCTVGPADTRSYALLHPGDGQSGLTAYFVGAGDKFVCLNAGRAFWGQQLTSRPLAAVGATSLTLNTTGGPTTLAGGCVSAAVSRIELQTATAHASVATTTNLTRVGSRSLFVLDYPSGISGSLEIVGFDAAGAQLDSQPLEIVPAVTR